MHGKHHVNTDNKSVLTSGKRKLYPQYGRDITSHIFYLVFCSIKEILFSFMHEICFTTKLLSIWKMVFLVSGLSYKMVDVYDTAYDWAEARAPAMWENAQICYLDKWVATRCCFDRSSAALCLIVRSVVGFGLHLYLQVILAKLAWQRPV